MGAKRWLVPVLAVVIVGMVAWLSMFDRGPALTPARTAPPVVTHVDPQSEARATADRALAALQARDGLALAAIVHPDGVRMSPSAFVDIDADQRLLPDEVATLWAEKTSRVWGVAEASGEPIDLTPAAYFDRHVLDHSYDAADVTVNGDTSRGTTVDNAASVYPGAVRVEYFRPGADATDWSALRLVLLPVNGKWWLVGIIHDEWTP
jgi:hypothetical protein